MRQPGTDDAGSATDEVAVDEVDRRLVGAMFAPDLDHLGAERTSLKELAETIGVHRNTVSTRLTKLREAGLFLPPVLGIDPTRVGHASGILHLDAPGGSPGDADQDALFALDGVEALITSLEGWEVPLHGRDASEVQRRADVAASLLDAVDTRWLIAPGTDQTTSDPVEVTGLDVRVVEALLEDARRPFREIAQEVGVSPKTVRRRYQQLRSAGVLYFAPSGYRGARGATLVLVEVDTDERPDRVKGAILGEVDDVLIPVLDGRERALMFVWTPVLSHLSRQVQGLQELEPVTGVRQRVITETRTNPRIGEWVGRMLREEA